MAPCARGPPRQRRAVRLQGQGGGRLGHRVQVCEHRRAIKAVLLQLWTIGPLAGSFCRSSAACYPFADRVLPALQIKCCLLLNLLLTCAVVHAHQVGRETRSAGPPAPHTSSRCCLFTTALITYLMALSVGGTRSASCWTPARRLSPAAASGATASPSSALPST